MESHKTKMSAHQLDLVAHACDSEAGRSGVEGQPQVHSGLQVILAIENPVSSSFSPGAAEKCTNEKTVLEKS